MNEALPQRAADFPRWFVPFPRNPLFTGREATLRSLYDNFHLANNDRQIRIQAICGIGGIGKTQVALEYAYRFSDDYTIILWLSNETPLAGVTALMDALNLPEKQVREHHQILAAFKRWLNGQSNWLLIFDNLEEFERVYELLPTHGPGHVLLTTQRQVIGTAEHRLNLQTWSTEEGVLFLLRRARLLPQQAPLESAASELRAQAADVCQELGGLPLALDQAGTYLEETGCTLIGYQQRFQEHQMLLLSRRGLQHFSHAAPVTSTILLAVEHVEQQFPAAAELLRLCAFLAADAIPEELIIKQNIEVLGPILYASATNPFGMDSIYAALNTTSLMELNTHLRLLTVHRLVQTVIRIHLDQEAQQRWTRRALLAVSRAFPASDDKTNPTTLSRSDRLLPHALLILRSVDRFLSTEQQAVIASEISDLLFKVSCSLIIRGYYQRAQPLLERCLSLREQVLGLIHPAVADPLVHLGYLLRVQGLHAHAEALLQRALAIYEQAAHLPSSSPISILVNLAMLSLDRGQYQQAETFMKRAILIQEQLQDADSLMPLLNDLATIYRRQGRYEEARALLLHALRQREQTSKLEDAGLVAILNNLADFYFEQGRYAEAQPVYLRVLRISEQAQISDDSLLAMALFHLAELYRKQERYEESESYYLRSLELWEQHVGPKHLLTAHAQHGLALLRMAQGQYKEAESLFQKAIQVREQAYDEANINLAEAIHDLALLYEHQGKDEEALQLFERALHMREQVLGPGHAKIAASLHHLGLLYTRQGRKEKASSSYQRSLALREQILGKWHPETQVIRDCLKMLQATYEGDL